MVIAYIDLSYNLYLLFFFYSRIIDCYDNCDLSKFPTNCTVSNNTKLFQNSSSHFKECYKAHIGNDTVCQNCGDAYNKMNTIYNDIRKGKGDKFCFDIKDKVMFCLKLRLFNLTLFLVVLHFR